MEDAERAESPLHSLFEWDDDAAAHQYRIAQARSVIRRVVIIETTEDITVSAVRFVPMPDKQGTYVDIMSGAASHRAADIAHAEANRALGHMVRALSIAEILGFDGGLAGVVDAWRAWVDGMAHREDEEQAA